jgi:hypothetical protein
VLEVAALHRGMTPAKAEHHRHSLELSQWEGDREEECLQQNPHPSLKTAE